MNILISLLKEMAIFLVIAYLLSKTPIFKVLISKDFHPKDYLILYFVFSIIAIIGTYFGVGVNGAIANDRAIGAALAGLIGGPFLGLSVGLTAGVHRFFLGGYTALACGLSTIAEGLLAGVVHSYFVKKGNYERVFDPDVAFLTAFVGEVIQMIIILIAAKPLSEAVELVKVIALPMIAANSVGTALIMSVFRDQKYSYDRIGSAYSKQALRIAKRILGTLGKGLNSKSAEKIAKIIHEETGVAAVAITNREKVLTFIGVGADHHIPGTNIASDYTKLSIDKNEIIFLDGKDEHYLCPITQDCKLASVLVVPMGIKDEVIGTIKLYEQKNKFFLKINKALGQGIAELVTNQLIAARYEYQKNLLTKSELKLIQAQINPHFLFNAINTIIAVSRRNSEKSRELLLHLSNYFRSNLKRNENISTIKEELAHVNSYLEIEKARFEDKLIIETEIDYSLLDKKIPTFTLQPLVENAIKHGISKLLDKGKIRIKVFKEKSNIQIDVEDNAGIYEETEQNNGLGIKIVDKRIKNLAGINYGLTINCDTNIKTTATIILPLGGIQ